MLKLKRMQRGIAPIGSGWGTPVFTIEIENDDAAVTPQEGKNDFQVNAEALLLSVTEETKKNGWENSWALELAGKSHGFGCYFVGDNWMAKENRIVTGEFFRLVARVAVETQRVFGIQKMTEPYFGWVGTPLHFTGMDDFYQQFNHCVVWCPLSKDYNQLAFMEQKNHAFTRFYFDVVEPGDVDKIEEFYGKTGVLEGISPVKVQLTASHEAWNTAVKYVIERGFRVSPKLAEKEGVVEIEHF